jgi:transcriptional regulator with GAF, ATPase, and Fis domain
MEIGSKNLGRFDRELAALSAKFVRIPGDEVDASILDGLERVGSLLGVDRAILSEFADQGALAIVKHSWAAPGVEPIREGRIIGPSLPQVFARLQRGQVVNVSKTSILPPGWEVDAIEFRQSNELSHLSLPFSVAGKLVGVFSIIGVQKEHEWTNEKIERLELIASVFANALHRRDSDRELRSQFALITKLQQRLEAENTYLREEISNRNHSDEMIGNNPALRRLLVSVEEIASTDVTILIGGETGTGKELLARAIHTQSARSDQPLICVNCAALPTTLIESELFGHEKGAFTGAGSRRIGRFELADRGTIFLDEVGDLPLEIQAKFLRLLEDGGFERLGSSKTMTTDARVIAATSRNLEQAVAEGSFRADLYYRLAVVPLTLPPLRDRRDDIEVLVWHFVEKVRERHARTIQGIRAEVMEALVAYDWPGNVRELEHVIERSILLSAGGPLELHGDLKCASPSTDSTQTIPSTQNLGDIERAHIISVLEDCGWMVKGPGNAAEQLGIHPSTLRGRMKRLRINRPRREQRDTGWPLSRE